MNIDLRELTGCGVLAGSDVIEVAFIDAVGSPATVRIPFAQAQSLLMTLPRLLSRALLNVTGQAESRLVFPLGHWQLDAAVEKNWVIATFATEDGFAISFGIPQEACRGLGWALKQEGTTAASVDHGDAAALTRLN